MLACVSRRVLCNIRSRGGRRGGGGDASLPSTRFHPPMGVAVQVNTIALLPHPHARNLGHDVRINYSELYNGVNQVRGQTYIRQEEMTGVTSLERRRTESKIRRHELTTLSIGSDWTFTATNLNILYRNEI